MYLFDDTLNRGSDAIGSSPQGDSFGNGGVGIDGVAKKVVNETENPIDRLVRESRQRSASREEVRDSGYGLRTTNTDAMQSPYEPGEQGYGLQSAQPKAPVEPYSSQSEGMRDPAFQMPPQKTYGGMSMEEAKKMLSKVRDPGKLGRIPARMLGGKLGNTRMFLDGSPESREKVKELAKDKTHDYLKDKIGSKIADKGVKEGFQKGIKKVTGKALKEGIKNTGKQALKEGFEQTAKAGLKTGMKAGGQALSKGLQTTISGLGAASAPETLGLGALLALLLNIAISLGLSDAIDCVFEIGQGNLSKARFYALRACTKLLLFIPWLIIVFMAISPFGFLIGVPLLIFVNIYMLLGYIFSGIAIFQGLTWWQQVITVIVDAIATIIVLTFLVSIIYIACEQSGFGGGGLVDWVSWAAGVIARLNFLGWVADYQSTIEDACKAMMGS